MRIVRIIFSLFVVIVLVIALAGWSWTSTHQPPSQALASHIVLAATVLAGCGGLLALWNRRRDRSRDFASDARH